MTDLIVSKFMQFCSNRSIWNSARSQFEYLECALHYVYDT